MSKLFSKLKISDTPISDLTIPEEKILHNQTQLAFLTKMGFIYGSVMIKYVKESDRYKKDPSYKRSWKNQTKSFYDPSCNGIYTKTGKISNCFVIDIDDLDNPESKIIMDMCKCICALICKTKRGYHYYFIYDPDITNGQYQEFGFDIRSDGGLIYCPPGYYTDENGNIIKYEYIISPEDYKLTPMSDDLKSYLLELIAEHEKPKKVEKEQVDEKEDEQVKVHKKSNIDEQMVKKLIENPSTNYPDPLDTTYVSEILKNDVTYNQILKDALFDCVSNLDPKRNDNYESWFKLGGALSKFGPYGLALWKEFSKQYKSYNEKEIDNKVKTFDESIGPKLGSLLYWLKIDNQPFYDTYRQKYEDLLNYTNSIKDVECLELDYFYNNEDIGYVTMYHNKFKHDLVYCIGTSTYYLFNDTSRLWEEITTDEVICHFMTNMKIIIAPLVEYYRTMAKSSTDKDKAKQFEKMALKIEHTPEFCKSSKASSMIPVIRSYFRSKQFASSINNIPDAIPVKNGVLNLRTGELRERTKFDYFTFELNTEWKGVDYPINDIEKFINDIMLNDGKMITYLQKLLGYSITGYTNLQKFVILWGSGGNGKGILQNLLMMLMGNYYRQVGNDVIIDTGKTSNPGSASPHLMHLLGARLAFVDESGLGAKLNETFVKTVTGGSSINARPLYGKVITFKPTFHLFLLTNNKPEINVDESTKRRVVLIPFLAEFRGPPEYDKDNPRHKPKDDNVEAMLLTKLDQLLTWIVRGSIKYFNEGLGEVPQEVANATKEYMNENDEIGNFINDVCDKVKNGYVYHSALFDKFKEQTKSNISSKIFTQMMKAKGYPQSRRKDGTIFAGLIFKANNDNDLDQ